jgi:acid phosphatase (class A)
VQTQEIDKLLDLQAHRTPEEEARCKEEVDATAFIFADVLGKGFNADDLPVTATLMKEVTHQAKVVAGAAKLTWDRKRPFLTDTRIKPCVELEKTSSYPSGHAIRGMVWALVLAEIYPEHRDALLARGREFGEDRVLAGLHYPSDVAAGQKLGAEIAKRLLADPEFRAKLDKAKEEALAHAHA